MSIRSRDDIPEELIHISDQDLRVREMRLDGKSQAEIRAILLKEQDDRIKAQEEAQRDPEIEQMMRDQEALVDQILAEIEGGTS